MITGKILIKLNPPFKWSEHEDKENSFPLAAPITTDFTAQVIFDAR